MNVQKLLAENFSDWAIRQSGDIDGTEITIVTPQKITEDLRLKIINALAYNHGPCVVFFEWPGGAETFDI